MLDGKMPTNTAKAIVSLMEDDTEMSLKITGPSRIQGSRLPGGGFPSQPHSP